MQKREKGKRETDSSKGKQRRLKCSTHIKNPIVPHFNVSLIVSKFQSLVSSIFAIKPLNPFRSHFALFILTRKIPKKKRRTLGSVLRDDSVRFDHFVPDSVFAAELKWFQLWLGLPGALPGYILTFHLSIAVYIDTVESVDGFCVFMWTHLFMLSLNFSFLVVFVRN